MKQSEDLLASQNGQLAYSGKLLLDAQRIGKLGHWVAEPGGEYRRLVTAIVRDRGHCRSVPRVPFSEGHRRASSGRCDRNIWKFASVRATSAKPSFTRSEWFVPMATSDGSASKPRRNIDENGTVQSICSASCRTSAIGSSRSRSPRNRGAGCSMPSRRCVKDFVLFDKNDRFVMANSHYRETDAGLGRS